MNQSDRIQLRQNIQNHFNKSELETICFDLGIDYENLSGETKETLVREMLRYAARQQLLDALLEQCRRRRPQLDWPEVLPMERLLLAQMPDSSPALSNEALEERRKQLILLEKVNNFWVRGVLNKSISQDELVSLNQLRDNEAIDHPWHEIVGTAVYDSESLITETSIYETFVEADQALLILGAPGSGKTTTLINLARILIALAEQNPIHPIPVILNLVSWGETRQPLTDWVVEELAEKYQIPRQFGRAWVNNNELLLLLDGLDEVPGQFRSRCVEAINHYRKDFGLAGLVVCSRTEAYEAISTKLKFGGAIVLQKLTLDQIDKYLASFGSEKVKLRKAIQQDQTLQEMARSPLMLNAMVQAYGHVDADLSPLQLAEEGRIAHHYHLFSTYVERMFKRRGQNIDSFNQEEILNGLSWLANQMTNHNQAVFLLEQIQPSWLSSRWWRWLYIILSRMFDGVIISIMLWIPLINARGGSNVARMFQEATADMALPSIANGLVSLFLLNFFLGIMTGALSGIYFKHRARHDWSYQQAKWIHVGLVGLSVGLMTIIFLFRYYHPLVVLSWSGVEAVLFGLVTYFLHGNAWRNDVYTTEALRWIWRSALIAGLVGMIWGLFLRFLGQEIGFYKTDIPGALSWGLIFFMLAGLRGRQIEGKNRPNEGMFLSGRNGLVAAVLFGIAFALFYQYALGVNNGLLSGLILGLGPAFLYGGGHVIKHGLVRLLLNWENKVPIRLSQFLDSAAELVLVYKVGGGYIFIHRLLQAFFALKASDKISFGLGSYQKQD